LIEDTESLLTDTAIQGEIEALSALYSGASSASYYQSRGNMARLSGSQAKSASRVSAAGTLIGGAGSTAKAAAPLF
jgi:hypothetical protein